ncbi:hypothetical protein BH23GEM9_BH23GEM9_09530 [soil metagenome]
MRRTARSSPDGAAAELEQMMVILAHDVRSPLHTIGIACDLLASRLNSPDKDTALPLDMIRESVAQIDRIVGDVLEGSFSPAAQASTSSMRAGLEEGLDAHRLQADARGVALAAELPDGDLVPALSRILLLRVLANLLSNAIRHTEAGGAVTVTARRDGAKVRLAVADTGCGIPSDRQRLLFEAVAPGSSSGRRAGHGLLIVKRIAEAAGGSISVVSRPDQGSTFTVILPEASGCPARRTGLDVVRMRCVPATQALRPSEEVTCTKS